eukprot:366214-Chlamydomonas_euryale.AAC.6
MHALTPTLTQHTHAHTHPTHPHTHPHPHTSTHPPTHIHTLTDQCHAHAGGLSRAHIRMEYYHVHERRRSRACMPTWNRTMCTQALVPMHAVACMDACIEQCHAHGSRSSTRTGCTTFGCPLIPYCAADAAASMRTSLMFPYSRSTFVGSGARTSSPPLPPPAAAAPEADAPSCPPAQATGLVVGSTADTNSTTACSSRGFYRIWPAAGNWGAAVHGMLGKRLHAGKAVPAAVTAFCQTASCRARIRRGLWRDLLQCAPAHTSVPPPSAAGTKSARASARWAGSPHPHTAPAVPPVIEALPMST